MNVEEDKISVLVCDDSALMRNLISRMVESEPDMVVVGKAMNGEFALAKIEKLKPDVVVLDLEMPQMDGIAFLKERQKRGIEVPVIILSSIAKKGAEVTMTAISLGAADFILKPSSGSNDIQNVQVELTNTLRAYGRRFKSGKSSRPTPSRPAARTGGETPSWRRPVTSEISRPERPVSPVSVTGRKPLTKKIEIVAIGISTGGPNALREVFASLDPNINVPMLVVQHMPAGFTKEFASSLNKLCPLEVKEAEDGDLIKAGRILIAPGDYHIKVEQKRLASVVRLSQEPQRSGHRPSADVLYESVEKAYGGNALAIIMTGMGKDGATEIGKIYNSGGIVVAQDEESSVVFGMPRVAIENGYADHVVSLHNMADTINGLIAENS
ncbi:MAG: chemotaxis response regulator protein-glutamate methylesterase [Spirochaetales bacterium]|nr:chemotaxis response regulator protein-glutamate methylesterase [Spirochaetales bacterium]